jgi:hypothetical protein
MNSEEKQCYFCGRKYNSENTIVTEINICTNCLQKEPSAQKKPIIIFPPKGVFFKRIKPLLFIMGIGLVFGVLVGYLFVVPCLSGDKGSSVLVCFSIGMIGITVFTFLSLPFLFSRAQHTGNDEYKSSIVEKMGLQYAINSTHLKNDFVMFAWDRTKIFCLRMPVDMGILFTTKGGLVFFGEKGTRFALPFNRIQATGIERLKISPTRASVCIKIKTSDNYYLNRNNKEVFVAFLEAPNFKENREKAKRFEQHLRSLYKT